VVLAVQELAQPLQASECFTLVAVAVVQHQLVVELIHLVV
jgi:hypothetical protein